MRYKNCNLVTWSHTRALGACLQGSRVRTEVGGAPFVEGLLHIYNKILIIKVVRLKRNWNKTFWIELNTRIIGIQDCLHVSQYYFINFVEGLIPRVSKAHCGYTSLHEYVITIFPFVLVKLNFPSLIGKPWINSKEMCKFVLKTSNLHFEWMDLIDELKLISLSLSQLQKIVWWELYFESLIEWLYGIRQCFLTFYLWGTLNASSFGGGPLVVSTGIFLSHFVWFRTLEYI